MKSPWGGASPLIKSSEAYKNGITVGMGNKDREKKVGLLKSQMGINPISEIEYTLQRWEGEIRKM